MIFGIFTLFVALTLASTAAWFSIAGLIAIFSASKLSIGIMGSVLEIAKLVSVSWLYRNWNVAALSIKTYLCLAVVVLMIITSMGIFGFLSKAHLEHAISSGGTNEIKIQNLERRIIVQETTISDAERVLAQLDSSVETLIAYDRIRGPDGALAVREAQAAERQSLNKSINNAFNIIETLQTELSPLLQSKLALEVEVGPLKYIAELIYGEENAQENFDSAIRGVILLLVVVFDPLAVVLLLAANQSLYRSGIHLETRHTTTFNEEHHEAFTQQDITNQAAEYDMVVDKLKEQVDSLNEQNRSLKADLVTEQSRPPRVEEKIVEVIKEPAINIDLTAPQAILDMENMLKKKLERGND